MSRLRRVRTPITPILLAAWFSLPSLRCTYPLEPEERDILTLERIWQYAAAFSIYQEGVPSHGDALLFASPQEILDSIHDTLRSPWSDTADQYAIYYPDRFSLEQELSLLRAQQSGYERNDTTIYCAQLTPLTVYLHIRYFAASTPTELKRLSASLIDTTPNLILDLMTNTGGDLDATTACIDLFLPQGTPYLVQTYRRNVIADGGEIGTVRNDTLMAQLTADSLGAWEGKNIAILIDSLTASAAEILAVALRDASPGPVMLCGQKSYGKSIGQYIFAFFSSSGGVKMTGMRFYPIVSQDYHERGIEPDRPLGSSTNRIYEWILAAGEYLETDFISHILDTGLIDGVVRNRGLPRQGDNGSTGVAASPPPSCYRMVSGGGLRLDLFE